MSGRIQYEAWLMALSLAGGAWLMMAYDILRLLRMAVRHNSGHLVNPLHQHAPKQAACRIQVVRPDHMNGLHH